MDSIDELLRRLTDESTSAGVIFQLVESPDPRALEGLIAALRHDNPVVRNFALLGLAERRDVSAIPAILQLLDDEEIYVRASAAFALGKMGDTRYVGALSSALQRSINLNAHLCHQLMIALMNLDETNCADALAIGLQSALAGVRLAAAEFLGYVGKKGTIQVLSEQLSTETDDRVRQAISTAITQLRQHAAH